MSFLKRSCVQEHVSASNAPDPSLGSLCNCDTVSLCSWRIIEHVCLLDVLISNYHALHFSKTLLTFLLWNLFFSAGIRPIGSDSASAPV